MRDDQPYYELRKEMFACGLTQDDIADSIGRSRTYVGKRLRKQGSFELDDAYAILDLMQKDPEELTKFFPDSRRGKGK